MVGTRTPGRPAGARATARPIIHGKNYATRAAFCPCGGVVVRAPSARRLVINTVPHICVCIWLRATCAWRASAVHFPSRAGERGARRRILLAACITRRTRRAHTHTHAVNSLGRHTVQRAHGMGLSLSKRAVIARGVRAFVCVCMCPRAGQFVTLYCMEMATCDGGALNCVGVTNN